ncbi:DUF4436 domain-containing protein [Mycolicibacterium aichiense]|uniref:DUF4436 domain-containing protein n=1 Tax=Mycolicibacterium aichiense TaxID=1799 RepID=A0AAD1MED9_9MYCO|nr:DUF4436 domain-containing protein [Mycolicibacterium aichiense]MCV7017010.1 DUF4436 domain-containing protein [Mycolicibacterium aichiense]BBX10563.1 DUF4436 domain-containing protein [Mycolicibacterium aichiense]STZ25779.1 transmembrane protein [Mycolicibacterium aichiense]
MGVPSADAPAPARNAPAPAQSWWRRIATVAVILAIYIGSVAGYFWIDSSAHSLKPTSMDTADETVVLLELTAIHPLDNRVDVEVLVIPQKSFLDPEFGNLTTDMVVQLCPCIEFGELTFPKGQVPRVAKTSLLATGDADRWPFDKYATETIGADVYVGSGNSRRFVPARVEVSGSLYGWDVRSDRTGPATHSGGADDNATVTFSRSRGPLSLIFGICLVLLTLPALALYAAIEMLLGKKKFQPPFSTWFAAMLFAVVPIRNVLPGDPPPGSWIDEALVFWVLVALVVALVIYLVSWARHSD